MWNPIKYTLGLPILLLLTVGFFISIFFSFLLSLALRIDFLNETKQEFDTLIYIWKPNS